MWSVEVPTEMVAKYIGGSNTKHVRISNGKCLFGFPMVWFGNGHHFFASLGNFLYKDFFYLYIKRPRQERPF